MGECAPKSGAARAAQFVQPAEDISVKNNSAKELLMSIVTISHAPYSGGSEIAEKLATVLNFRCVDREVLLEASRRYGIPEAKYTEVLEAEGHWWERWMESLRLYRITLQAAMCEVAQGGRLIYYAEPVKSFFREY